MCVCVYALLKRKNNVWVPNLHVANSPHDNSSINGKTSVGQTVTITAACSD